MLEKKKVLFFSSPGLWPMLEYEIDLIHQLIDDNHFVEIIICHGGFKGCVVNKNSYNDLFNPFKCVLCKSRALDSYRLFDSNCLKVTEIIENFESKRIIQQLRELFSHSIVDFEKVKNLVNFHNIDIFESAVSTLTTTLFDSYPDLQLHKRLLLEYIIEGVVCFNFFDEMLAGTKFEKIYLFNGRISRYRPLLRICQNFKFNVNIFEFPEIGFDNILITPDVYPHDFSKRSVYLKDIAINHSNLKLHEKIAIGEELIEKSLTKVSGEGTFYLNFVENQQKGTLPDTWNVDKFNVVVFTSTLFENAGVEEHSSMLPEGSQQNAISLMRKLLNSDVDIYVRIHPNNENQDYKSKLLLEGLDSEGLHIIKSNSPIDTYELIREGDIIVTFGSSVTIEAAYLRKPVISFGNTLYTSFDFSYNLYDINSSIKLINEIRAQGVENLDFNKIFNDACLFMYARKMEGIPTKLLKKKNYWGAQIEVNNTIHYFETSKLLRFFIQIISIPYLIINKLKRFYFKHLFYEHY